MDEFDRPPISTRAAMRATMSKIADRHVGFVSSTASAPRGRISRPVAPKRGFGLASIGFVSLVPRVTECNRGDTEARRTDAEKQRRCGRATWASCHLHPLSSAFVLLASAVAFGSRYEALPSSRVDRAPVRRPARVKPAPRCQKREDSSSGLSQVLLRAASNPRKRTYGARRRVREVRHGFRARETPNRRTGNSEVATSAAR
jgi:hypothetical protein